MRYKIQGRAACLRPAALSKIEPFNEPASVKNPGVSRQFLQISAKPRQIPPYFTRGDFLRCVEMLVEYFVLLVKYY